MTRRHGQHGGNRPDQAIHRPLSAWFGIEPDVDGARRWAGSVRRVALVEIDAGDRGTRCRARGQGRRLPFDRAVPLSIGLGLTTLGVPLAVRGNGRLGEREPWDDPRGGDR
jgi:hypothetical protein